MFCVGVYILVCRYPQAGNLRSPRMELQTVQGCPTWVLKNSDPLQEQYILLTAEPHLQANTLHQVKEQMEDTSKVSVLSCAFSSLHLILSILLDFDPSPSV